MFGFKISAFEGSCVRGDPAVDGPSTILEPRSREKDKPFQGSALSRASFRTPYSDYNRYMLSLVKQKDSWVGEDTSFRLTRHCHLYLRGSLLGHVYFV